MFSELESRQGPTCHHPTAGHYLPDHHRRTFRQELPRLSDVRSREGCAALHPGAHGDPPLLLLEHRGQGNPSASLEEVEKHSVRIGQIARAQVYLLSNPLEESRSQQCSLIGLCQVIFV